MWACGRLLLVAARDSSNTSCQSWTCSESWSAEYDDDGDQAHDDNDDNYDNDDDDNDIAMFTMFGHNQASGKSNF